MSNRKRRTSFRRQQRGQTLVIVALMIVALLGFIGLVTDIGWYEVNLMRVQRAADAAALAGAVYLPSNVPGAVLAAQNEAAKNGYADGVGGVTVSATPETGNKILGVVVTSPVR
jgi:Flp pilus assembly protein TadG